jgi:hypothetical protein
MKLVAIVLVSVLAVGCGSRQPAGDGDPCSDFALDVEKVWNTDVRLKLDIAIKQFGAEGGVTQGEKVATQMDAVTRDWVMLRESACNDHLKRKLITAEEYRGKVACFDAFLERLRTMIAAIEAGDGTAVGDALAAPQELDRCK